MGEKIKCPHCESSNVREMVTIVGIDTGPPNGRIPELDEEHKYFRCLKCGQVFSERGLED